eukprot:6135252-Karenia_brevis.AAC.1
MGYQKHRTATTAKSDTGKANPQRAERIKVPLVSDSFRVGVVARLLGWWPAGEGLNDEYISFNDQWAQATNLKPNATLLEKVALGSKMMKTRLWPRQGHHLSNGAGKVP